MVIGECLDGKNKMNWVEKASYGVMEKRRRRNCLWKKEDLRGIDRTSEACEYHGFLRFKSVKHETT